MRVCGRAKGPTAVMDGVAEVVMTEYGTLLRDHVTLRLRSIDRIFLQAYAPKPQALGDVCTFLRWQRKYPIPSLAAFGKIGDAYVKAVYRFAEANHIPVVHFKRREERGTARLYLKAAARDGQDRVVLIGVAQQKVSINHFSFYRWDSEWGAAFWKTNSYAPWNRTAAAGIHPRDGCFMRSPAGRSVRRLKNRNAGRNDNRAWRRRGRRRWRRSRSASAMAAGPSPPVAAISQSFFDGILSAVPPGSASV